MLDHMENVFLALKNFQNIGKDSSESDESK